MRHREHAAGEGEEVAVLYLLEDGGITQSADAKRQSDKGDIDFNVPSFFAYVFYDSDEQSFADCHIYSYLISEAFCYQLCVGFYIKSVL